MAEAQTTTPEPYTIGKRYSQFESTRSPYLERGRACSALTIPSMLPPSGHNGTSPLPTPWQAIGSRGVNHLAAKLTLTLFPMNSPFFKYNVDEVILEKMTGQPELKSQVDEGLAKYERSIMNEFEANAIRTSIFEAIKHLLVAGNVLLFVNPKGMLRIFRMDRYVVKRDPMGNLLEIIIKEDMSPMELSDAGKAAYAKTGGNSAVADETTDTVCVYTRVYKRNDKFITYQDINGHLIEGTVGQYPVDKCPYIALRWTDIDNEDYGRGMIEEYFGDLKSLEALSKAIVQAAAAAAKVLFLIRPNSTTKARVLAESESGDIRDGNAEDVTVLQMDKYADFRVAFEMRNELKQSLSMAFLLNTAIQRNGERVTAEEIRFMAEELESSLGGVYSALSQTLQRPLVIQYQFQMQRQGKLPALPDGVVKINIVTGVEALGRGQDLNKLKALTGDLTQIATSAEALDPYMQVSELIKRITTAYSVDPAGLMKTPEETAQALQVRQQAAMAQKLGPNVVNQGGALLKERSRQQHEAAQQGEQ